ncbi:MAG: hypothetical protein R3F14_45100, partial [Polyangiaceae bacterium]
KGQCIETWGRHPAGVDPALDPDLPKVLADGKTLAKGVYHCCFEYDADGQYSEVIDSVRLQRFFAGPKDQVGKAVDAGGGVTERTFDEHGRVTSRTDATGATWSYQYDAMDNLITEVDPEGHKIAILRDEVGRPIEMVDPEGGTVKIKRDAAGEVESLEDQNGAVTTIVRDARSLMTATFDARGGTRRFEYDAHANLIAYTTATGGRYEMTWDYWGRCTSEKDPMGNVTQYVYSDNGFVTTVVDALGQTRRLGYDSMGNLVRETMPDGTTEEAEYGGLNFRFRFRRADGSEIRTFYNREGWPTKLVNERGETWELERTRTGQVLREKDFTGRTIRYTHDALGRVTSVEEGGEKHSFTLNQIGQVVTIEGPDGEIQSFEHNARGDLTRATSGDIAFEWVRDRAGNVVRETFHIGDSAYQVTSTRTPTGDRWGLQTSLGHDLRMKRDLAGAVTELWSGPERALAITRDLNGSRVHRELAEGGAMLDSYDPLHRRTRRRVIGSDQPTVSAGEPEWLGGKSGIDRTYEYTPVDEVRSVSSADGTTIEYSYDLRRHIVDRRKNKAIDVELRTDAAGNYHEAGGAGTRTRTYAEGGKLTSWGDHAYEYASVFVKKWRMLPGAADPRSRYEWSNVGCFQRSIHIRRTRVCFDYDAFARACREKDAARSRVIAKHHYVWDLKTMIHDIAPDAADKPTKITTYLFEDNEDVIPIGSGRT